MGIFDKIKKAIFGGEAQAAEPEAPATPTASPAGTPAPSTPTASPTPSASPAAPSASASPVDVSAILDEAVRKNGQKLDWRRSIVDLMKALDMDSSLSERKELAQELGYTGDMSDSATMNMWLHKALMKKLADNGGKVPADLLD